MKFLLTLCCAMMCGIGMAAECTMVLNQQNATLQAPAAALDGDTLIFTPNIAVATYSPTNNSQGMYYFHMDLFQNYPTAVPQIQIHFLSSDTLTITDKLVMVGAVYYPTMKEDEKTSALNGSKVAFKFEGFAVVETDTLAGYQIAYDLLMSDGKRIMGSYDNVVYFYNEQTKQFYIPTREGQADALETVEAGMKAEKVMLNGEILIRRGDALYDLRGNRR